MKQLIINADDFGFSQAVTDGILKAHTDGCVTSTTLMPNMPDWRRAVDLAKQYPSLSVGVHLTLTQGYPVLPPKQVSSLVDPKGHFLPQGEVIRRAWRFRFSQKELIAELTAQMDRAISGGLAPTHIDSHHHIVSYPQTYFALLHVIRQFGVRRMRSHRFHIRRDPKVQPRGALRRMQLQERVSTFPHYGYYLFHDAIVRIMYAVRTPNQRHCFRRIVSDHPLDLSPEDWERFLMTLPPGITEMSCHPGYMHDSPEDPVAMRAQRVRELQFLTDPKTQNAIQQAGVRLVSYRTV